MSPGLWHPSSEKMEKEWSSWQQEALPELASFNGNGQFFTFQPQCIHSHWTQVMWYQHESLLKFTSWIYFIQRSPPLSLHLFCQLLKSRVQVSLTRKVSSYPDHLHCLLLQLEMPVLLLPQQPDVLPAPGETTVAVAPVPSNLWWKSLLHSSPLSAS